MKKILFGMSFFAVPAVAAAQTIQSWVGGLIGFLSSIVIPLIIAIAFVVFIWKAVQFFIFQASNKGNKEKGTAGGPAKAQNLMIWGIAALVIIFSLLGIVNLLVDAGGFGGKPAVCPDYICR